MKKIKQNIFILFFILISNQSIICQEYYLPKDITGIKKDSISKSIHNMNSLEYYPVFLRIWGFCNKYYVKILEILPSSFSLKTIEYDFDLTYSNKKYNVKLIEIDFKEIEINRIFREEDLDELNNCLCGEIRTPFGFILLNSKNNSKLFFIKIENKTQSEIYNAINPKLLKIYAFPDE